MQANTRHRSLRLLGRLAIACAVLAASSGTAFAQLDPLLFMRTSKPNVLILLDAANRMQRDANNDYYDQFTYRRLAGDDATWEASIGVTDATTNAGGCYRRKYVNLSHLDQSKYTDKFQTDSIVTVGDRQADCSTFDAPTRMAIARAAVVRAITLNYNAVRFGLIRMRQSNPQPGSQGNVAVWDNSPYQQEVTETNVFGKWKITRPTVDTQNGAIGLTTPPNGLLYEAGSNNASIRALLQKGPDQGGVIPAGMDSLNTLDAPVQGMLADAKYYLENTLIKNDTMHRNTVCVLIAGGGEGTTSVGADPVTTASSFLNISGRRVPVYVVAIAPLGGDSERAQLRAIATNSGGQYFEITRAMIEAVAPGSVVPELVRAVNSAIQHAFASETDFNTAPTALLPYGPSTEFQVTSPIIGTIDLSNSVDINGVSLPYTVIYKDANVIPQRSNVVVTTGVAVPGGDVNTPSINTPGLFGKLRAFRVFRPEPDATKTAGYKFVGDGTALWIARAPTAAEGLRNIYTALPDGTMVSFDLASAGALTPYLALGADSTPENVKALITYIRGLPLGAFLDGTPAFLDAPSLDPPPDSDYPAFREACKGRRTLIFVGGNDGMLHAIDGRTGVEVWAFIPFNLLPKLRALRSGQPLDQFRYMVDGSPKIADVKIAGAWRSYIMFGEGPGGTFYQTLDATMTDLAATVASSSSDVAALLAYFGNPTRIAFKWSFPSYAHFNYAATPAADYTSPYNTSSAFGDLDKTQATDIEKRVGQTWSDPAVGEVKNSSGSWVALVGSGFLPYSQQQQPNRGGIVAGTTFYVLDMATGAVLGWKDVGNDGKAETIDNCAVTADITKSGVAADCTSQKNGLQSDPVATGPPNSRFIDTAYICDLDGRLWRFTLALDATNQATIASGPGKLFDARDKDPLFSSMAVVNVGGTQQYIFLASGSDLLPAASGTSHAYNLYSVLDTGGSGSGKTLLTLATVDGNTGAGEKVSAYPAVAGDIVFFTTTTYKSSPWLAPDTNIYAMTFVGGPAYDNTGDDRVTSSDTPKVATLAGAGRATAPFVADQHLVLGSGGNLQFFGDPEDYNNGVGQVGVRILSWREIR